MAAIVDAEKCTGCESCVPVCPVECITVEEVAVIAEDDCIECGVCVDECPEEAISLPG
jgi:NAD-dependent dihydropyrimidine dehydrogenase PreA subunit